LNFILSAGGVFVRLFSYKSYNIKYSWQLRELAKNLEVTFLFNSILDFSVRDFKSVRGLNNCWLIALYLEPFGYYSQKFIKLLCRDGFFKAKMLLRAQKNLSISNKANSKSLLKTLGR
jgi:hypothetical protein